MRPTRGSVAVRGRLAALLELGAGFHPEISGRENIEITGLLLGLTKKEIAARFDDVVRFAGVEEFLDAPVKTYSSGMAVRLGFAIAAHSDPDVLLVDEVLAVGDEAFAHRALEKFSEFERAGKTLVFVSHDLGARRRALPPRALARSRPARRRRAGAARSSRATASASPRTRASAARRGAGAGGRIGSGVASIEVVRLLDGEGRPVGRLRVGRGRVRRDGRAGAGGRSRTSSSASRSRRSRARSSSARTPPSRAFGPSASRATRGSTLEIPRLRSRARRLRARRRGPRARRRALRLPARRAALRGHGGPAGPRALEPAAALELLRRRPVEGVSPPLQVNSGRSMRSSFLPFARPSLGEEEIREVVDTLRSGWITTGPKTERFASEFLDYVGGRFAVPVSSATAGLHAALLALGVGPGDEVVTTPMTFVATLNTIVHCGAVPVLVDIDAATLQIRVEAIEAALTPRTKAIVPVHYVGQPADLDPLLALAGSRGIAVLEDAAHAVGTEYRGRRIGSFPTTSVFSFHPNKNMTTGEGGMIVTDDEGVFERASLLKFHGMDREAWKRFAKEGSPRYDVAVPGFKYNMMDIQAALGLHQLKRLDGFIAERARLAARYDAAFRGMAGLILPAARSVPVAPRLAPLHAARGRRPADDLARPVHGGAEEPQHRHGPPLHGRPRVLVLRRAVRLEAGRLSGGPLRLRADRLAAALPRPDGRRPGRCDRGRRARSSRSSGDEGVRRRPRLQRGGEPPGAAPRGSPPSWTPPGSRTSSSSWTTAAATARSRS